ncbi:MAG: trigger factor [Planctomycetaceae bacterium]|jgi:trigger factor|nr:trigger factor [Planctomycetaceae bacterium]
MSEQEIKKTLDLTTDVQKISSCERRIKVTVPQSHVAEYFQNEYAELEKTAYVPGFRVGKAPRKLVEKRFRKDVVDRVKHALVVDSLSQVNDSSEFTPISEPDFDLTTLVLPEAGDFVFEFSIEVRPEFDLPEWKGLKLEKPVREFTAEDVNKAVKRVLGQYANLQESAEPIAVSDIVTFNATVKSGETVLNEVKDEMVEIRSELTFHDGTLADFGAKMTGAKTGETVVMPLTLSEDAPNTEYRGKTVDVHFEIVKVSKVVLPELTKEFLDRIGGFETEADFRDTILDSMKRQLEHEQHRRARLQITESLTVAASWELPPGLLKRQQEREFRRTIMELQRSGYDQNEVITQLNAIRQNSAAATAQALKEHFILEKIAEVENVQDTPEDYDTEVALIAAQSGQSPRRVRAQIEKSGEMDILRNQIIERKVIAMINANALFSEVPFEWGQDSHTEALDWAAGGNPEAIANASEDDLKAVHQEIDRKKRLDPNTKIK